MKVQKAILANSNKIRWLVIDNDYLPVKPIQQYLNFLVDCNKSPLTLRTYAHHLKIYWEYLNLIHSAWDKVSLDTISNFVGYLKGSRLGNLISLNTTISLRSERTINQIIVAVSSFYNYHHRLGNTEELPLYLTKTPRGTHSRSKSLLHHITKGKPIRHSLVKLREKKSIVKTVTLESVKQMLNHCKYKRDKFLLALLYETGCRIGQALGLRHEDIETYNNIIRIVPRENNTNHARAKTKSTYEIHVSKELMSLYCEYFLEEYGDIDCDYVFINLWGGAVGQPLTYNTVIAFFKQISIQLGSSITPHMLRHTHATELLKAGWDMAYIQKRLGHKDIQTTMNIYTHLTKDDEKKYYQEYIARRKVK